MCAFFVYLYHTIHKAFPIIEYRSLIDLHWNRFTVMPNWRHCNDDQLNQRSNNSHQSEKKMREKASERRKEQRSVKEKEWYITKDKYTIFQHWISEMNYIAMELHKRFCGNKVTIKIGFACANHCRLLKFRILHTFMKCTSNKSNEEKIHLLCEYTRALKAFRFLLIINEQEKAFDSCIKYSIVCCIM